MSDSVVFSRRDFLKLVGIGVAGASAGCSEPADKLIPYLVAPEDILPGVAYWYASTCRECPVGCGVLVKAREGRAIKVEGNPEHPLNRGGLCARGQASLQGLYDPDRVAGPMLRTGDSWRKVSWDEALKTAGEKLGAAVGARRGIALVTEHVTGSFDRLGAEWAAAVGGTRLVYEPFGHQALREANRRTFGHAVVPSYDFARARHLLSFGADFLETWASPVSDARGFAEMRRGAEGSRFIAIEPRLSLTGANADEWIAIRPGTEMVLALGMVNVILGEGLGSGGAGFADAVSGYTPDVVAQQTDVPAETVKRLARDFVQTKPSLAVAGGIAAQSEQSVATIAAVNLLNWVAGNVNQTVRFDRTHNYDSVASHAELQRLARQMSEGAIDVVVVNGTNPVYGTPAWSGFAEAMGKVPFKIAISGTLDETAERCDLVLPSTHWLETIGDAESLHGVWSVVQPAMRRLPMFDARPAGDTLIALAKSAGVGASLPASWTEYVRAQWMRIGRLGPGQDFDTYWNATLQKGWVEQEAAVTTVGWTGTPAFAPPTLQGAGDLTLVVYPSPAHYDGRGANKPWLQELPDPTTKAVWGSWVEIHPETAAKLGVSNGDAVKVETDAGSVEVPAYLYAGLRKDTIAIPLGQGHSAYGRFAKGTGVNALTLLPAVEDAASGSVAYLSTHARLAKGTQSFRIALTQRNKSQADREVAQIIPIAALMAGVGGAAGHAGEVSGHPATVPGGHASEGHEAHPSQTRPGTHTEPRLKAPNEKTPVHALTAAEQPHQVRSPRQIPVAHGNYGTAQHRWAMAIDLDRCTGCAACIVACNAENNIPTVGPELIRRGREMMWLRIERFEEKLAPGAHDVRFLPMLCQHCTDAPCETVCPVYATYHNPEGLNAQVYNRCVGTRYCSNNCPYKVRSFNFFDYAAPEKETYAFPEPLNWQLNPDVTVRSKGVMEKCTFCIQRILEGKGTARDENRRVLDLEIKTACQQSCPTQAIVFGDLTDPESEVSRLSHGDRRYWVLNDLNTKPGITYLKKIRRETPEETPQHG